MKRTIESQRSVLNKRERLLQAIINNVNYLSNLHRKNKRELEEMKAKFKEIEERNQYLESKTEEIARERDDLKRFKKELQTAQRHLKDMLVSS